MIFEALIELSEEMDNEAIREPNSKTKLYGTASALDSITLVSLITDLEERIADDFGAEVVLADEKAMSRQTSPFRNVESLTNYIESLLEA